MKKLPKILIIFCLLLLMFQNNEEVVVNANQKFEGQESYYLNKCAQRLTEAEAQECAEFKVYYESLGQSILEGSRSLSSQIESLKQDLDKLVAKSEELTNQIKALQAQKGIIEGNIAVTNDNIVAIQKDIEDLKLRIEARQKEIKKRMQDNQLFINGNRKFSFILESSDFADLLRRISILGQISRYDEERIQLLKKDQAALSDQERELNRQKEELVYQKDQIEAKEKQVEEIQSANQVLIIEYLKNKADIEERQRSAEADYATIVANASKINTSASSQDITEIVSNNINSSGFGPVISGGWYRSAGTWYYPADFGGGRHLGMDFAGYQGMGQPLVAPADAIVLMTKNGCADVGGIGNRCGSPISGAGNWVILATEVEGVSYTFMYYHLMSGGITSKNRVSRGEVIGYMGSSGSSTGPHLHLEIITHGSIGLQQVYNNFVSGGYDPAFGAGWGVASNCESRGMPCRIRPETIYGY